MATGAEYEVVNVTSATDVTSPSASDALVAYNKSTGGLEKIDYDKLAKAIIENYASSSLAGSTQSLKSALDKLPQMYPAKTPRCKDITSYVTDGTLWTRINNNYDDIMPGDYITMSRAITCPNIDGGSSGATGSKEVTVLSLGGLYGNGDSKIVNYNHLVMAPGKGLEGTQHFGQHQMNATNTTEGGYQGSVMNRSVIGPVVTAGSTASGATINEQLYAEFGSHLKTIREMCSNAVNTAYSNRYGQNNGASSGWSWMDTQAVLMSEAEVYGTIAWSSSGYDTVTGYHQFELFNLSRRAINNRSAWYWLRDVTSGSRFAYSDHGGYASYNSASYTSANVRPRFILAA